MTALALETARLRYGVTQLEQRHRSLSGDEIAALDAAHARADAVANLWGDKASAPVAGERPTDYRRRLLATLQTRAPNYKNKNLTSLPTDLLGTFEDMIYADAAQAGNDPSSVPPGQARAVQERDAVGRLVTRWVGNDPYFWMQHFMSGGQTGTINRNPPPRERAP